MWLEFFVTFLYSEFKRIELWEKNLGLNVKSSLSEIAKKYGIDKCAPVLVLSAYVGIKKPDCLFTVGSGWKNFGK